MGRGARCRRRLTVGTHGREGGVQYFIHVVGVRKSWYQRNVRINSAFPFLPTDHSAAAAAGLHRLVCVVERLRGLLQAPHQSPPAFQPAAALVHRQGLIYPRIYSLAHLSQCRVPQADALPLSRPIPVYVDVSCASRPLALSCADDPTTFLFPRLPNASEVSLELVRVAKVRAGGWKRETSAVLQTFPVASLAAAAPTWLQDNDNPGGKGGGSESSCYSATLSLRCPPVFETQLITSKVQVRPWRQVLGVLKFIRCLCF